MASVLLVDDSATARLQLRGPLEKAGYKVFEANNGEEGINFLKKGEPRVDLVLTDHNMPNKTGLEMVEDIRGLGTQNANSNARVIMVSSESSQEFRDHCASLKIKGLLIKPVNTDALVKAIMKIVPLA